jgi:hypothetical protein
MRLHASSVQAPQPRRQPFILGEGPDHLDFYLLGMHRISGQPDIRPDNPVFFNIRYPAGYQIVLPDIR